MSGASSPWDAVVGRFRRSRLARAAWLAAKLLFLAAGLAPLLSHGSPLLYSGPEGWSAPVLVECRRADLFWFGVLALYACWRGTAWWSRRRDAWTPARRQATLLACVGGMLGLLVLLPLFSERLYPERWDKWRALREHGPSPEEFVLWTPVGWDPLSFDEGVSRRATPPSSRHWLGTDPGGRDLLARLLYGARVSLVVGFGATALSLLIGLAVGAAAGYCGGWVDLVLSRVIEVVLCMPNLFLILIVFTYLPRGLITMMVLLGLLGWTGIARLTRAEFLRLRGEPFVTAARALGASPVRIIVRHLLPNAMAPVLVAATFGIAGAILTEASLSFLGFGVPPPTPTWGEALYQGRQSFRTAPWILLFPGLLVFVAVTSYNLVGEALRDALDPRWQERES